MSGIRTDRHLLPRDDTRVSAIIAALTVKVVALMVAGFIGSLKVTENAVLTATPVAPLAVLGKETVGAFTSGTPVLPLGTPGPPPPPPPPQEKRDREETQPAWLVRRPFSRPLS